MDLDGNPNTGCEVATPSGSFAGVEAILTTFVETDGLGAATVTGVERRDCDDPNSNTFGPPQVISAGGWPVGIGNGQADFNVIETFMPVSVVSQSSDVHLALVATDELGNSSVLTTNAAGGPILLGGEPLQPLEIPMASGLVLFGLALVLLLVGSIMIRRRGRLTVTALVCLAWGSAAGAACVLDGEIFNWSLADLLAETGASDPENGVDIRALFAKRTDGSTQLCFRIDAALVFAAVPVAADDDYTTVETTLLDVTAGDGLLANDGLGIPAAELVSFGGGDLGGAVGDHAAGTMATVGVDGILTANADGSFQFQAEPGFEGDFAFDYRIENVAGFSDATVKITVNSPPAITSADNLTCVIGLSCELTFTADGFPDPTFSLPNLPAGLSLDATTGLLSGTPAAGTDMVHHLTLTATNGIAPDDDQAFTLTINKGFQVEISTFDDVVDGNTTSMAALLDDPGTDGAISLREAIIAANNDNQSHELTLLAGTYNLTISGADENFAATGDLDIRNSAAGLDLVIRGQGAPATIIDAGGVGGLDDRVFEVIAGAHAIIQDLTVTGGNVTGSGGGIMTTGTLELNRVTIDDNRASGFGGGIRIGGSSNVTIDSSTISNNTAAGPQGAGGIDSSTAQLLIVNSTISGNSATSGNSTGGIYADNNVTIINSTITNNTAATGTGGIRSGHPTAGTITLGNTIVAGNTAGGNPQDLTQLNTNPGFVSQGHNLIGAGDGIVAFQDGINGDQVGTIATPLNAMLGPLSQNDGTTFTHALLIGSPAIDAGDDTFAPLLDQRLAPRVGVSDIGAFEFGGVPPP